MRCLFGMLKRGVLSQTFVWKLRIAVNFFTPVVEGLTASESVTSFNKSGVVEMGREGFGWNECLR